MARYWAPSSPGDLADRWSILNLKLTRCPPEDEAARSACMRRLRELAVPEYDESATALVDALGRVNAAIWDLEDTVRATMAAGDAHDRFVRAARCIPVLNDTRNHLKRRIDQLCGYDDLQDVKVYAMNNPAHAAVVKPPV